MRLAKNMIFVGTGIAMIAGCASSDRTADHKDLFADPSKFESLASSAYASPITAVPTELATAPIPASQPLVTGATLVSPALTFVPEFATAGNRAPASVAVDVDTRTPDRAYSDLIRGNERFVNGTVTAERRDGSRRREIATATRPFAVVLSCSDSRTAPELIFDQGLGDIVSIRVAGNVLGSAQVATIEDAVENLGARLIVVLGHDSCSAVKAALEPAVKGKHAAETSPDMDWLVTSIRPGLKARGIASATPADTKLRAPVSAHIDAVAENLGVRSRIIGDAVSKGQLKIVRGVYSLESGRVDFWGLK